MRFFTGLHQPADAKNFGAAFISVNRLRDRKGSFAVEDWIMDSVAHYAEQIRRWKNNGNLLAAVSQDYMCEAHILKITGMTIEQHQQLTVERYDALLAEETGVYILPVLQGFAPSDYVRHLGMYGARLALGQWVGVGSICKRNGDPGQVLEVLRAIKTARPDLRLHGFGLKTTALDDPRICALLYTADSMAWSFAARKQGRNANDWREAMRFTERVTGLQFGSDLC